MSAHPGTRRVSASATLDAAPSDVYEVFADYRVHHGKVVPPQYFRNLVVESGGRGAGTVFGMDVRAYGRTRHMRAEVTEPEPGRVLSERDLETGWLTTFTIEPASGGRGARVTIATEIELRPGIAGSIEGALVARYMRRVYPLELERVREYLGARR